MHLSQPSAPADGRLRGPLRRPGREAARGHAVRERESEGERERASEGG